MTAKVTIELDDKASGPLKDLSSGAKSTDNAFSQLEAEVKRLTEALEEQAASNRKVEESQNKVTKSSSNVAEKITAVATGTLAAIEVLKKMAEAGRKAFELIKASAEQGNPAAIAFVDSIEDLQKALADVANDPLIQDFLSNMADTITGSVIPAIKGIPDAWRGAQNWISGAITATTDFVGITEGAAEVSGEMADQQERATKAAKERAAAAAEEMKVKKAVGDVDKELAKIDEAKRQNAEREALAQVKSSDALIARLEKEKASLRDLAASGKLDDTEKQKRLADIVSIEGRLLDIKKEQTEASKKATEDTKKWWEGLKANQKTIADASKATFDKMAAAAQKNVDALVAKEKAGIDALAAKLRELKGADGKTEDVLSKIKGGLSDNSVLQQIGSNRQKQAEDAARAAGKSDSAIAAAGKRARGTAFKQAQAGGTFNPDEVAKAQDQLVSSTIDQAAASGELSVTQTKALRAAATAQMEAAKVAAQQQQDIEQIAEVLDGLTDGAKKIGQRQRAQRGAAGR